MHGDRGDIIAGYLVRLVLGLTLAGMLLIEGGALLVNRVGLDDAVQRAAEQGASAYAEHRSAEAAERAAEASLNRSGADLVDVGVERGAVTVTGTRHARVLASDRVDALASLVAPTRTGQADRASR